MALEIDLICQLKWIMWLESDHNCNGYGEWLFFVGTTILSVEIVTSLKKIQAPMLQNHFDS